MVKTNADAFDSFSWVHENYVKDPQKWQRTFNVEGERIMEIVRKYENILCGKSQRSGHSAFTTKLSEKFMSEVRSHFPKIDRIGLQILD